MFLSFAAFQVLFFIVFGLIVFTIISNLVRQGKERRDNDNSPVLDVRATVVSKRQDVSRYGSAQSGKRVNTEYFVAFQVESGDRMELKVTGSEYGLLIEGDCGMLRFQGTRFLEFRRG